jgi:hypothetical protein
MAVVLAWLSIDETEHRQSKDGSLTGLDLYQRKINENEHRQSKDGSGTGLAVYQRIGLIVISHHKPTYWTSRSFGCTML